MTAVMMAGLRYCEFRDEYNYFVETLNMVLRRKRETDGIADSIADRQAENEIVNHAESIIFHARELVVKAKILGLIEVVELKYENNIVTRSAIDSLRISAN